MITACFFAKQTHQFDAWVSKGHHCLTFPLLGTLI
jgi:hypothetical protein